MLSVEGGAGAERYVQVGVRWRSVESSAGDDGDSPLVEVRLLLSSRQGKVHLKMSYNESNDNDSHSEEEIGPAGVEVHWQLYE